MSGLLSDPEAGKVQHSGLLAKVKTPLFYNWLLIIVVGLIVLSLSAGAFPLAWTHLMQMIGDWSTLQAASGSAMYGPFAILLLQVLCFLVAWTMLVLAIVREILAFKDGSDQAQSLSTASAAGSPTSSSIQDTVAPPDTAAADADEQTPFDMDSAIFELPSDQDEAEPEEEKEELLAPTIIEEEAVFVYGDPLAGDLPEIFSYDTDLMRDVQELREKASTRIQTDQNGDSHDVEEEPEESSAGAINQDEKP
jgi:hypothetical protein